MTKYATACLDYEPLTNAMHGERFAWDRGTPLNAMVTLNFDCLGISDEGADQVFRDIRARVGRAWKHRRTALANMPEFMWLYIHANPQGKRHVHWLVHVPEWFRAEFEALVMKRVCKVTQQGDLASALDFTDVTEGATAMKYIGRGVNPAYQRYFHMRVVEDEGVVTGRRIMTSRNISRAARKAAGWDHRNSNRFKRAA